MKKAAIPNNPTHGLPMNSFLETHSEAVMPEPNSGCWLWIKGCVSAGYGVVNKRYAHRQAFESVHGIGSADGLLVRHKCDTPCCVNPDHLLSGTKKDNAQDAKARNRLHPLRGEAHQYAKLTTAKVIEFRARFNNGESPHVFAAEVGMAVQAVKQAIHGETWTHIPGAIPRAKADRPMPSANGLFRGFTIRTNRLGVTYLYHPEHA